MFYLKKKLLQLETLPAYLIKMGYFFSPKIWQIDSKTCLMYWYAY